MVDDNRARSGRKDTEKEEVMTNLVDRRDKEPEELPEPFLEDFFILEKTIRS